MFLEYSPVSAILPARPLKTERRFSFIFCRLRNCVTFALGFTKRDTEGLAMSGLTVWSRGARLALAITVSLTSTIAIFAGGKWILASAAETIGDRSADATKALSDAPLPVNAAIVGDNTPAVAPENPKKEAKNPVRMRGQSVFRIHLDKNRIKLRGPAPNEEDKKIVLGMIEANFPGYSIQDKTKIDARYNTGEGWLSGVSFVLRQMALLRSGAGQISDHQVSITGVAETAEKYQEVEKTLSGELPTGLILQSAAIKPPEADYTWLAQLREGSVVMSGHVPDETAQKALTALAEFLFPEARFDNKTEIIAGAPNDWMQAAQVSLRALRLLQSGSVSIANQVLRVDGVPASEEAGEEIDFLTDLLPLGFIIENESLMTDRALVTPGAVR